MDHYCEKQNCQNPSVSHHFSYEDAFRQRFPFPKDVIDHIIKILINNTSEHSTKLYFKLYSSCKYFYDHCKVIPCTVLEVSKFRAKCCYRNKFIEFSKDLLLLSYFKLLPVCMRFHHFRDYHLLKPKLINYFSCGFRKFSSVIFTLTEFLLLIPTFDRLELKHCIVYNSNGDAMYVEEIFKLLPNLVLFVFIPSSSNNYTPQTAKNLLNLERNKKLKIFWLTEVPEFFDVYDFVNFIKKNTDPKDKKTVGIHFASTVDAMFRTNFINILSKSIENLTIKFR